MRRARCRCCGVHTGPGPGAARHQNLAQAVQRPERCPRIALHATFASGPGIMQDQLRKLLDVSELPNTKVQIVPLTAHPTYGSNSSMTILTFNHPWAPVASIDNPMGGNHTEDPEQAQILEAEFDHIASAALPVDKPRDLLIEYMERLHK
ncbi:Scr1 family TA system antitoxin-like transcriptional regulator [Streptomyces sp. NPDC085929]|uniref:Scr1 family TA system antitoxin-like transcriptional regulator n=1 Tax=Streptomyces sp. NPDC085929 TaxID=3365739 RepID=UPI0037CF3019